MSARPIGGSPEGGQVTRLRVFIAASGSARAEIDAIKAAIHAVTHRWASLRRVVLEHWQYDDNAGHGPMAPQRLIDPALHQADVVIGLVGERLGPGTQHEIEWARDRYAETGRRPWLLTYFQAWPERADAGSDPTADASRATIDAFREALQSGPNETWPREFPAGDMAQLSLFVERDLDQYVQRFPVRLPPRREAAIQQMSGDSLTAVDEDAREASRLFGLGQFEESLIAYRAVLTRAEVAEAATDDSPPGRSRSEKARVNIVACLANLSRFDEARLLAQSIDATGLERKALSALAQFWLAVDEPEKAQALFAGASSGCREFEQQQAILRGEVPRSSELVDDPWLRAQAALTLTAQGQFDRAASLAMDQLADDSAPAILKSTLLEALVRAASGTIWDEPKDSVPVPRPERSRLVRTIEAVLASLPLQPLGRRLRGGVAHASARFFGLSRDARRVGEIQAVLVETGTPLEIDDRFQEIAELRALEEAGRYEDAEAVARDLPHSWAGELSAAEIVARHDPKRALLLLERLDREFPGRMPVDHLRGRLLLASGFVQRAQGYAERAAETFPGLGQRMLLARCLLSPPVTPDDAMRALQLVGWQHPVDHADALYLAGAAQAHLGDRAAAVEALRRAWEADRSHVRTRFELARQLAMSGQDEEAADHAWAVFEQASAELGRDEIYTCGGIQLRAALPAKTRRTRVGRVGDALRERFPTDARAEAFRHSLWLGLDQPMGVQEFDLERLVEAGYFEAVTADAFVATLQSGIERAARADKNYRDGRIPLSLLCEQRGETRPELLARYCARSGSLSTPVRYRLDAVALPPSPVHLLASGQELYLLEELGLLDALTGWLGSNRHLLLFRDDLDRIHKDDEQLRRQDSRSELALDRLNGIQSKLRAGYRREVRIEQAPEGEADTVAAGRLGGRLVTLGQESTDTEGLPAGQLVDWLGREAGLAEAQLRQLRTSLGATPEAQAAADLDGLVWLPFDVLDALERNELLGALLETAHRDLQFAVGPAAWAKLHGEKRVWEEIRDAVRQARRVADWCREMQAEGLLLLVERPALPEWLAPALPSAASEAVATLREAWSYFFALDSHAARHLLVSDFFVSSWTGFSTNAIWLRELGLNREQYDRLYDELRPLGDRALYLTDLITALRDHGPLKPHAANEAIDRLAELGFSEALTPEALRRWHAEPGGLGGSRRVRERQNEAEWVAWRPAHVGGFTARLRVAGCYADVIHTNWCGPMDRNGGELHPNPTLLHFLLDRAARLDAQLGTPVLDQLMRLLAARARAHRTAWAVPSDDPGMALLSGDSPAGRLWGELGGWARGDRLREAAVGRALSDAIIATDLAAGETGEPHVVEIVALAVAAEELEAPLDPDQPVSFLAPARAALAILSANWATRPLGQTGLALTHTESGETYPIDCEAMLQAGAQQLATQPPIDSEHLSARYTCAATVSGGKTYPVEVRAPFAALLLRVRVDRQPEVARALAAHFGPYDGRLRAAYLELAAAPGELGVRRRFAQVAADATWREVRDDPSRLMSWLQLGREEEKYPGDLVQLRQLLSEPGGLEDGDPYEFLLKRANDASGCWRERPEATELVWQASRIPLHRANRASFYELMGADTEEFEEARAGLISQSVVRLERSWTQPAAVIESDILFLRAMASETPTVQLGGRSFSLQERIPGLLTQALEAAMTEPAEGTLAGAEPALLRLCARIIDRLALLERAAQDDRLLPSRERLWLTWRLEQWVTWQLEALTAEQASPGLARIERFDAPPSRPAGADALEPAHLGRGKFDFRVATVLRALATMDSVAVAWKRRAAPDDGLDYELASVWSPALRTAVMALASRALTTEELALRSLGREASALGVFGPISVPDLALGALLAHEPEAFFELDEQTRGRWLRTVPSAETPIAEREGLWPLMCKLLGHLAGCAERLSSAERRHLLFASEQVRDFENGPLVRMSLRMGLARQEDVGLDESDRTALLELGDESGPTLLAGYLAALCVDRPDAFEREHEEVLAQVQRQGRSAVPYVLALAPLVLGDDAASAQLARDRLAALAARPPWRDDERVENLVHVLGIEVGDSP
jgi:tetratricopeptide (TPR) repeat protein